MARLIGVEVPDQKKIGIALRYIYGIGPSSALEVCAKAKVDPNVRAKIFDPFFTTKPSGTGLGLSICREIADFHRARLTLVPRSILGGTVAEVEFPCMAPESQPT